MKTKVVILTAIDKRIQLAQIFIDGMNRFFNDAPEEIECTLVAVVSSEDGIRLCQQNGIDYVYTTNLPLGNKWNTGMSLALKKGFDWVGIFGDDDFIASKAWTEIYLMMRNYIDHFGFSSLYIHELSSNKSLSFSYKKRKEFTKLIGAGRFISRRAVENTGQVTMVSMRKSFGEYGKHPMERNRIFVKTNIINYLQFNNYLNEVHHTEMRLWDSTLDKGLDKSLERNLVLNGYSPLPIHSEEPMILDIKSGINLWSINNFNDNGEIVSLSEAISFLSANEIDALNQLQKTNEQALNKEPK